MWLRMTSRMILGSRFGCSRGGYRGREAVEVNVC